MLKITYTDKREDPNYPKLPDFDIESVVKATGTNTQVRDLTIDVVVLDNPNRELPTTVLAALDGEERKHWLLTVNVVPRDELSYGASRALNRSIARHMFVLDVIAVYGEMWGAMYTKAELMKAQTKFADQAPEAIK